ncbi:uncharacterized protein LOC113756179 [Coffea eugenioides]|uniref:uncharacterized protein LOC113756179 n=1 Tax=Coffea eugenioides TaxID=49369 RepID=UPI000F612E70|nr:uncharacterized protein LOC113756179 [Coffea eugenioides]
MYEGVRVTPTQVTQDDRELMQSGLLLSMTRRRQRLPRWVTWVMPPSGCVKLNIDGSSLGNPGPSGTGGVLRDSDGTILSDFSSFLGLMTNMEAEALALLEGMRISAGFHCLHVEMDSQVLMRMVTGNGSIPWKLWSTISRIKTIALGRQGTQVLEVHEPKADLTLKLEAEILRDESRE